MEIQPTQTIQRTNIDYLGHEQSKENRKELDELNARFDIEVGSPKEVKETKEVQKADKVETNIKEPMKTFESNIKLNQVLTHNVVQNIPTTEIMKMMAIK